MTDRLKEMVLQGCSTAELKELLDDILARPGLVDRPRLVGVRTGRADEHLADRRDHGR